MRVLFCWALALVVAVAGVGCESDSSGPSYEFGDNDPNKIVCLGDSITGEGVFAGVRPYPSHLASMLPERRVLNYGLGGETSAGGAARVAGILRTEKPGYLAILYGANDVIHSRPLDGTIENLRAIVRVAKNNQTVPLLATCTPMSGSYAFRQGSILRLNGMIRDLAREENVPLVDLERKFTGSAASDLFPDGLHPDNAGHAIVAAEFARRIR